MKFALVLVPLAACSFTYDDPVPHYVENEGRVCLRSGTQLASGEVYEADATVVVTYETPGCLSSSCDTARSAACAVAGTGASFSITSSASWSSDPNPDVCTADCGVITAICETAPLPAGTYTFSFASESLMLTVPSSLVEPPCAATPDGT